MPPLLHPKKWRALLAFVLAIGCLVSVRLSLAQPAPAAAAAKIVTSEPKLLPSQEVTEQLAVVRAQLADARDFQSNMLSTVYWSLGTLASVSVLLAGFGWFINLRVYERDKTALERELKAAITNESNLLSQTLRSSADAQFATNEKAMSDRTVAHSAQLQASTQGLITSLEKALLKEISSLVGSQRDLKEELLLLQIRMEEKDREDWLRKQVLANALDCSIAILKLAKSLSDEHSIADALDKIKQDLDAIQINTTTSIDNYQQGELSAALESVKGRHAHSASNLKQRAVAIFG
jgi:hypothetical protein